MSLFVSILLALIILGGGFSLSMVVPRWFRHQHRSAVMITLWVFTVVLAVGVLFG